MGTHFKVAVLASGSKGNATVIGCGQKKFLIDVGISCRRIEQGLKKLGMLPQNLDGVFLTHEHIDHVRGLATFCRKYAMSLFASPGTWDGIAATLGFLPEHRQLMEPEVSFGPVKVCSFAVSHDARQPLGYTFTIGANKLAYVTDTGFVNKDIREAVQGAETVFLEANHDIKMLKEGSYPYSLKKRILSTKGHLDNEAAAWLVARMSPTPTEVFLAHLSQENNRPELAVQTMKRILDAQGLGTSVRIYLTQQDNIVSNYAEEEYHEKNIFA